MKRIYVDYAAATPVDDAVLSKMLPYFTDTFANPSALYMRGVSMRRALDDARESVAKLIGAKPTEIIWTAGGTESANLAITGVMHANPGKKLVVSATEHKAVLEPAMRFPNTIVPVTKEGVVKLEVIEQSIDDDTVLVSIMLANNEVGSVQPISQIAALISKIKLDRRLRGIDVPLLFHTDACQAPLYLECNVHALGVDLMTLNGGKIYGPKQSGILFVRAGTLLSPIIFGGGQEFGLRSGTENVAFAVGFAEALKRSVDGRSYRARQMIELRDWFMDEIEHRFNAEITGSRKKRNANNVHAIFPGSDNERVVFALDDRGVEVGIGSACSASSEQPSHVLRAMGYTDDEIRSSLRFSFGKETTKPQLENLLNVLAEALKI